MRDGFLERDRKPRDFQIESEFAPKAGFGSSYFGRKKGLLGCGYEGQGVRGCLGVVVFEWVWKGRGMRKEQPENCAI